MNSEMADNSMAQFVYGVDILQQKEVASTVSYPVLLIPVLIRSSMCTYMYVSLYMCVYICEFFFIGARIEPYNRKSHPETVDTTYTFTTQVTSLSDDDVGNYTCLAKVRPEPLSTYLTGIGKLSGKTELRISEMNYDRGFFFNNNYNSPI